MQTISTKYHGPTNCRGSKISATASGGARIYVSYNYALNADDNHRAAAFALMEKLNWEGEYIGGDTKDGMVFVYAKEASIDRRV